MASYGKISIKEGNDRGYIHRSKQSSFNGIQKDIYCLRNSTSHAGNRVTRWKQRISTNTLYLNKEFNHILLNKLKNLTPELS
jgi:hypothetical protein